MTFFQGIWQYPENLKVTCERVGPIFSFIKKMDYLNWTISGQCPHFIPTKNFRKPKVVRSMFLFLAILVQCSYLIPLENTRKPNVFWPMFRFYTPGKQQKAQSFIVFSGGMKWEHLPKMG